ncbi:hypothetical protein N7510_007887 [Penicillium lagena]|uniref:uncharacterized protein n=1 Tax=Penicillium lagena TaxID=94218 RepID=UPI002540B854|nr:uncharacterized protein N7510_007887 [Penicillium lagena]KAJ5611168.1 hypothetical protein N7510_007887 [Penicillium lagena]
MRFSLLLLAGLAPTSIASSVDSTVKTSSGTVKGTARDLKGILSFKGIPFAAPPTGEYRWKAPRPALPFNGTHNANSYGPSCYNAFLDGTNLTPPSEDCLSLNIWTGASTATEKRPVMIWIYGGGFEFGSSAKTAYDGTALACEGVIVVTFNYRVGVLGFLALEELDEEGGQSGNFGLQDQLAAIRWVKKNIASFGGDPDNITIWGESAGAHSVGILMASPLSNGLFHKAIMESGSYWDSEHGSLRTYSEARLQGASFEAKLGVKSVHQLRALSADIVNNAAPWNESTDPGITAFAPSIDKYVIPDYPGKIFDLGQTQKVPLLAGFNAGEDLAFLPRALPHSNPTQFRDSAEVLFGNRVSEFLQLYLTDTQLQVNESADILVGDLVISEQTFEAIDRQARASGQKVHAYYYNYTSPYSPAPAHSAEVAFVFGNLVPSNAASSTASAADKAFSKKLRTLWTNFAKTGDPNGHGLPQWPQYIGKGADFMVIGNTIGAIENPRLDQLDFIKSFRAEGALPSSWRHDFVDN